MEYYFVMAALEGFNADHTEYSYVGDELYTDSVKARKAAKTFSRLNGVRTYVAKLVTRYKPGTPERNDY